MIFAKALVAAAAVASLASAPINDNLRAFTVGPGIPRHRMSGTRARKQWKRRRSSGRA